MNSQSKRTINWIVILLIAGTAVLLRVAAIDRLPPGLFGDEAVEGLDALDVLAGNLNIWFHAHLGREPLYVYLAALSYSMFGVTPLATRLPALFAGLLTLPAAFFLVREWGAEIFPRERATRLALLTTTLLAISFWHIQMTRNAHRDTLLPLVEAVGYGLLWHAVRAGDWRAYAGAGAVLGLAIYTYSPGRFVSIFVAMFCAVELLIFLVEKRQAVKISQIWSSHWRGLLVTALVAFTVMLPLGIYFAQNPVQFSRRFASVSIFDYESPGAAFASSVVGNLAQFVVPGAGYQSKHYNLPGKPVFDVLIAPWFLIGLAIAVTRWKQPQYRFLLLWFAVMMMPAFLTADMIPKGVRVLGVVPGVLVFPALAMDALCSRFRISDFRLHNPQSAVCGVAALCIIGSAVWTTYDYFVAWANMPELPLAFDADLTEVGEFIQRQPGDQPIYISEEVYRSPTLLLLGERIPTSRYVDRAVRFKESDARMVLISGANQENAIYIFVRDDAPPEEWLARVAPHAVKVGQGKYFVAHRLGAFALPQHALDMSFNPLLRLVGYSHYADEPRGLGVYWQVAQLPTDRADLRVTLSLVDTHGTSVTQDERRFGVPPLEWAIGDTFVEWYALDVPGNAGLLTLQLTRGGAVWWSPALMLK